MKNTDFNNGHDDQEGLQVELEEVGTRNADPVQLAFCDICPNQQTERKSQLVKEGWFLGYYGEFCPIHASEI